MTQGPSKTGRRYSGLDADQRTRQRRDAILAAALELFGTNGYAATSVKQICREAALTERYFYESFTDRHACLVALYSDLAQEMSTATTTAIADATAGVGAAPVDEITSRALGAFVEFLTADPRRARVVLIQVVGVSPDLEQLRHEVLREFAELTTAVWLAPTSRDTPTDAQRLTAVGLVGAVNHLLVNWLMTGQRDYPAVLAEVCSSLFSAVSISSRDCTRSPPTGSDRDSQPRRYS